MRAAGDRRGTRRALGLLLSAVIATVWSVAAAADPPGTNASPEAGRDADEIVVPGSTTRPSSRGADPGLDALLQLPSGYSTDEPDAVGGAGEREWRRRFVAANGALAEARAQLAATRAELDSVAGEGGSSQWAIAPPGGGGGNAAADSPMSFKLRQQLREDRERIDELEKALRELRIEADLAGVPAHWRVAESDAR